MLMQSELEGQADTKSPLAKRNKYAQVQLYVRMHFIRISQTLFRSVYGSLDTDDELKRIHRAFRNCLESTYWEDSEIVWNAHISLKFVEDSSQKTQAVFFNNFFNTKRFSDKKFCSSLVRRCFFMQNVIYIFSSRIRFIAPPCPEAPNLPPPIKTRVIWCGFEWMHALAVMISAWAICIWIFMDHLCRTYLKNTAHLKTSAASNTTFQHRIAQ